MVYPPLLTLMRTPRLPAVDWTDSPADLNGLVRLDERRNVVSARVPSGSARAVSMCQRASNNFIWPTVTSDFSRQVAQVTLWRRYYFPLHSARPPLEITGFNVFVLTLAPNGKGTRKTPQTGLYKNEYNWLTHMLHRSGTETSILRRSLCIVQHKRVNIFLIID